MPQVLPTDTLAQGASKINANILKTTRLFGTVILENVSGANNITATLHPDAADIGIVENSIVHAQLYAASTNTGPVTLSINGSPALPVVSSINEPLVAGDLVVGRLYTLRRSGNNWRVILGDVNASDLSGVRTELRDGRVWNLTLNVLHPSGVTPPTGTRLIFVRRNNGPEMTVWRNNVPAPADGLETDTLKVDSTGQWWQLIFDSRSLATLQTEVRDGRVWNLTSNLLHPSGSTPPVSTDLIIVRRNNGIDFTVWRNNVTAPADGLETPSLKVDSTGQWWQLIFDSAKLVMIGQTAGLVRLSTLSGTGDAIIADPPIPHLDDIPVGNNSMVYFRPTAANTTVDPTITTRGVTRVIKDSDGAPIGPGHIRPNHTYILNVRSNAEARIVAGGINQGEFARLMALLPPVGTPTVPIIHGVPETGTRLVADYGGVPDTIVNWQVHDTGIGTQDWVVIGDGETHILTPARIGKFIRFRHRVGPPAAWTVSNVIGPVVEGVEDAEPDLGRSASAMLTGFGSQRRHVPDLPAPVSRMTLLRGGVGAAPPIDLYRDASLDIGTSWLGQVTAAPPTVAANLLTTYNPPQNVIHPCMVEMYNDFHGYRYVCAITGFPSGPALEDPFVYGSNDRVNWEFLGSAPQPLAVRPMVGGYNSDTFLTHDPRTGELIVGWRMYSPRTPDDTTNANSDIIIYCRTTRDGQTWSETREIMRIAADVQIMLSPSLIFDPETLTWHMWVINRPVMHHWTASSLYGPWTLDSNTINISNFNTPHHHEVKWVGNRLICLMYSRGDGNLYFGSFAPGSWTNVTWNMTGVLNPRPQSLYKASFIPVYDKDAGTLAFDLWWTFGANGPAGGVDYGLGRALQYARTNAFAL